MEARGKSRDDRTRAEAVSDASSREPGLSACRWLRSWHTHSPTSAGTVIRTIAQCGDELVDAGVAGQCLSRLPSGLRFGDDERSLAGRTGGNGVDHREPDRRWQRTGGSHRGRHRGRHRSLDLALVEAAARGCDQHAKSVFVSAHLPTGGVDQVEDLVEHHGMDPDGLTAIRRGQHEYVVRTAFDPLDQPERPTARASPGRDLDRSVIS